MIDGGCWVAFLAGHSLGCAVARSSGRQEPVEGPWACWACSFRACEGSGACLVGRRLEGECAGWGPPPGSRLGRGHQRRSRCRPLARAHSGMPVDGHVSFGSDNETMFNAGD